VNFQHTVLLSTYNCRLLCCAAVNCVTRTTHQITPFSTAGWWDYTKATELAHIFQEPNPPNISPAFKIQIACAQLVARRGEINVYIMKRKLQATKPLWRRKFNRVNNRAKQNVCKGGTRLNWLSIWLYGRHRQGDIKLSLSTPWREE